METQEDDEEEREEEWRGKTYMIWRKNRRSENGRNG
jgi:hypothetical protein